MDSFIKKKERKKEEEIFYTSSVHVVHSAVLWRTWKASVRLPRGSFGSVSALLWPGSGFIRECRGMGRGEATAVVCPLTSLGSLGLGHRLSPKQAGSDRTSISPSKALETAGSFSQMGLRRIHAHSRCYNTVAAYRHMCPMSGCSLKGYFTYYCFHPHVVSNLYSLLSSVEHKRWILEEYSRYSFQYTVIVAYCRWGQD